VIGSPENTTIKEGRRRKFATGICNITVKEGGSGNLPLEFAILQLRKEADGNLPLEFANKLHGIGHTILSSPHCKSA
jgi:hypothetical protein